jgi:hypothetical protein
MGALVQRPPGVPQGLPLSGGRPPLLVFSRKKSNARIAIGDSDQINGPVRIFASFRFDACELHHLAPLLGFVGDEFAEVCGRASERIAT